MILFPKSIKNKSHRWIVGMILLLSFTSFAGAQEQITLTPCWFVSGNDFSNTSPASDNENSYFLDTSGALYSINNAGGFLNWRSDLSGDSQGILAVNSGRIFIGAGFSEESRGNSFFTIARTAGGVPLLRLDFSDLNAIKVSGNHVYLVSSKGVIRKLEVESGKELWKTNTKVELIDDIALSEDSVFVATVNNSILKLSDQDGSVESQFNTGNVISRLIYSSERLFAGSNSGHMIALTTDGKELWRTISGGGISEIEIFQSFVIFSSNDNFVYGVDVDTGKKKWKRKLAGRILGSSRLGDRYSVFTTTGSNTALVLDKHDGRIAGKYEFKGRFNGSPVTIPGGFAVATSNGIRALRKNSCENQKRPLVSERPS